MPAQSEITTPSNKNISERYPYNNNFLGLSFLEKINTGEVKEDILNDKVKRILRLMYRTTLNRNRPLGSINNKAHSNTAYKVATEGIVLLKNEDNLLPIDIYKKISIAIIDTT